MNTRRRDEGETSTTRFTFVEMLFALAIGEVAVIASDAIRAPGTWQEKLPVSAHLILAAILIATSWLGWTASLRRRNELRAEQPFSWDFLGLSVDVLLVVLYFILVRQAEISEDAPYHLTAASAEPEAWLLVLIFGTYVLWDLVTDVWKEPRKLSFPKNVGLFIASSACSLVCTALAWVVWTLARSDLSGASVVTFDIALISVVLLFRVIKGPVENRLRHAFQTLQLCRAFQSAREPIPHENKILVGLLLGYGICVFVATHVALLNSL